MAGRNSTPKHTKQTTTTKSQIKQTKTPETPPKKTKITSTSTKVKKQTNRLKIFVDALAHLKTTELRNG